jgi:DNA-binding XRE family transcriptional regulator
MVSIITLKRRRFTVREVPIPPKVMARLDRLFGLRRAQQGEHSSQHRLWKFCRQTAWRIVKHVMSLARVFGRQACPRGLRHSFGVNTLQAGVPLNLIQRWMGHARLSTTAIYANVCGPEEASFAARFWQTASPPSPTMPRRPSDELDRIIGANIQKRRLAHGMTQTELGKFLSVSFQQVQKYERGESSITAVNLVRLAVALKCRLDDFFRV